MKWNYLDLFSGIGGFRLGLEMAGFQWGWTGHSEIDKYANKVYHRHWPESEDLGDVREISISGDWEQQADTEIGRVRGGIKSEGKQPEQSEERRNDIAIRPLQRESSERPDSNQCTKNQLAEREHLDNQRTEDSGITTTIQCSTGTYTFSGRINLITFGFPCQDLSIAGKRGGLQANRSGLFFEAMRIVRDAKPDYFVFENVKGLFSSNGGFDWLNVLREVADSGYDGQWQLLNTRVYLPQNRERIFFVGYPSGTGGRQIFPVGENDERIIEGSKQTAVNTLSAGGHSGGMHSSMTLIQVKALNEPQYGKLVENDICQTMTSQGKAGKGNLIQVGTIGKDSEATRVYSPEGCARTIKDGGGMGAKTGLYEVTATQLNQSKNFGNCTSKDSFFTLRRCEPNGVSIGSNIRRLTPVECARLQGFPDDHCHGLSDTQQYKCYGNSVTTLVVKAVGERILKNE